MTKAYMLFSHAPNLSTYEHSSMVIKERSCIVWPEHQSANGNKEAAMLSNLEEQFMLQD
jgi:hypothetical protein